MFFIFLELYYNV